MTTTPDMSSDPLPALPEDEFWERYNRRYEFPISAVTAVLLHVAVAAVLAFVLFQLMSPDDRSGVPVKLIDVDIGTDDAGGGSPNRGGDREPVADGNPKPGQEAEPHLPTPSPLPDVNPSPTTLPDTVGDVPLTNRSTADFTKFDALIQGKTPGEQRGAGPGPGRGDDGKPGTGPGGDQADSARKRSLRWVLRFRTEDGRDYVHQLAELGAVILVPLPPENKECLYFTDLKKPTEHRKATDDDLRKLADLVKFSDTRADSVRGVCGVLGVKEEAKSFWAFFPKEIERELAEKEVGFKNRRVEDIEETVFRVSVTRSGKLDVTVVEQKKK